MMFAYYRVHGNAAARTERAADGVNRLLIAIPT